MTATNTIGIQAAAHITVPHNIQPALGDIVRIGIPGCDPIEAIIRQVRSAGETILSAAIDEARIDALRARIGAGIAGIIDINGIRFDVNIAPGSQEIAAGAAIVVTPTVTEIGA